MDGTPQIVLSSSSSAVVPEVAAATFEHTLLEIYRRVRPTSAAESGIGFNVNDTHGAVADITVERLAAFRSATVFVRTADSQHRVLLIVHQSAETHGLRPDQVELLHLVSDQLAKLCACLMIWAARPRDLGAPFSRLTDREWMVLRGLNSDAGEKQLADQLGLSPHTLHSHIKSIYRKVGVQGRLPLLLRAEEAMRGLRADRVE